MSTLLLSNFSNWFFKVFAKIVRKLLIQLIWFNLLPFLIVIYPGGFLKFTGMLSILERNLLQCIFSVSKWPPQAVVRMYTEYTSIAVEMAFSSPFLKITILYKTNIKSVQQSLL